MANSVIIDDYYELLALHRVLMLTKFSHQPVDLALVASPLIADISNRIVEALAQKEVERGRSDRGDGWRMRIVQNSPKWDNMINNALQAVGQHWKEWDEEKQSEVAAIFLSPFVQSDDVIKAFIDHMNTKTSEG